MALFTVSEVKAWSKGTFKAGDTLFVDGVPHVQCARCGAISKASEGQRNVVKAQGGHTTKYGKRDARMVATVKPYMITVGYWVKDETIETDAEGHMLVKVKWYPKLSQRPGCFDCWHAQDVLRGIKRNTPTEIVDGKVVEAVNHLPFYDVRDLFRG